MPVVTTIELPPPRPFVESEDGAEALGAAYRFVAPRMATEPLVFQAADGATLLWTPTELVYGDVGGQLDYIAGSAPTSFTVRGRSVHYPRTFPASEEVHVATPEGRKYWLYLYEPPRQPAPYLSGNLWFGVSGMVGGIPLPPGRHTSMESDRFRFQPVYAEDTMGARVEGWYEVADTDDGQQLFICVPAEWLLSPDRVYPVKVDPTVGVTTSLTALTPWRVNHVATLSKTKAIAQFYDGDGPAWYVSNDGCDTWQRLDVSPPSGFTSLTYNNSLFADEDRLHIVLGRYYHYAKTSGDTLTFIGNEQFYSYSDLQAVGWWDSANSRNVVVVGRVESSSGNAYVHVLSVAEDGTITTIGTFTAHTDARGIKIVLMPDRSVWAAIGATSASNYRLYVRKYSWTESGYTAGNLEAVSVTTTANVDLVVDASGRLIVVDYGGGTMYVRRRSLDGMWEDLGFPTVSAVTSYSATTNGNDIYVVYTNNGLYLCEWSETDGSWGDPVLVDSSTDARSATVEYPLQHNRLTALYITSSSSPYSIKSFSLVLNEPPQQPTNLVCPNFDATEDATFTWQHNDEPGDGQAQFRLQIRLAGADTDLVDTGEVQSPVSEYTLPGGTLANGQTYQWRVRTADQSGEWSPWSDYAVFQTGPKPQATILYPTEGTTVSTAEVTVEWSVPSQSSATVRLYDGTGQTVLQEAEVTTPSARARTITGLDNNQSYQVSVQPISSIGVVGDEVFSGPFDVAYTPPPKPSAAATGVDGRIRITITNPTPADGEPEVTSSDLYRRSPGGAWVRIAAGIEPNGTYDDYAVGSGVVYEYRARAIGDNGTYTDSDVVQAAITIDSGIWLHDPHDPANTAHHFLYHELPSRHEPEIPSGTFLFAGRKGAVVQMDASQMNERLRYRIFLSDETDDYDALWSLFSRRTTLCLRNHRGRKAYVVFTQMPTDFERRAARADVEFQVVDFDEGV